MSPAALAPLALWLLAAAPAGPGKSPRPPAVEATGREPPAPAVLRGPEDARRLCESLEFPERASAREAPVDRAAAEARQEERRARALGLRYRVDLAGPPLAFDHDEGAGRLSLTERAQLVGAGGALRLWATEDPEMTVAADGGRARRIAAAAKSGELVLRLVFALPEDEEVAICSHSPGTGQYGLGVEPVSWAYLAGKEVLARGGEEEPDRRPAPGGKPRVEIGEPLGRGGDGPALRQAVAAREKDLAACYAAARRARPALDGSLALELDLDPGGGPARSARVAMDSLMDEKLSGCALEAVRRAEFPRGKGGRVQVPLHFTQEPPAHPQRQ